MTDKAKVFTDEELELLKTRVAHYKMPSNGHMQRLLATIDALKQELSETQTGYDALGNNWNAVHNAAIDAIRAATIDGTIPEVVAYIDALKAERDTLTAQVEGCREALKRAKEQDGYIYVTTLQNDNQIFCRYCYAHADMVDGIAPEPFPHEKRCAHVLREQALSSTPAPRLRT